MSNPRFPHPAIAKEYTKRFPVFCSKAIWQYDIYVMPNEQQMYGSVHIILVVGPFGSTLFQGRCERDDCFIMCLLYETSTFKPSTLYGSMDVVKKAIL